MEAVGKRAGLIASAVRETRMMPGNGKSYGFAKLPIAIRRDPGARRWNGLRRSHAVLRD